MRDGGLDHPVMRQLPALLTDSAREKGRRLVQLASRDD
jgi:hypothetical protein